MWIPTDEEFPKIQVSLIDIDNHPYSIFVYPDDGPYHIFHLIDNTNNTDIIIDIDEPVYRGNTKLSLSQLIELNTKLSVESDGCTLYRYIIINWNMINPNNHTKYISQPDYTKLE